MIILESQTKGQEDGERKIMQWGYYHSLGTTDSLIREEDTPPVELEGLVGV